MNNESNLELQILKAARAKIADKRHWTRGVYATDAAGAPVTSTSPEACRWCALGAVIAAALPLTGDRYARVTKDVIRCLTEASNTGLTIDCINDQFGHARVLEIFDAAIKQLEGG